MNSRKGIPSSTPPHPTMKLDLILMISTVLLSMHTFLNIVNSSLHFLTGEMKSSILSLCIVVKESTLVLPKV